MADNLNTFQSKLDSVLSAKARTWTEVAEILNEVERTGSWKDEAPSFTQWVHLFSKKLKLGPTSLWRYKTGHKILHELRTQLQLSGIECPEFEVMAANTNPQNLEHFGKLSRVLPASELHELRLRIMNGTVYRDDLRKLWTSYRPLLEGKTTRGKGQSIKKLRDEARAFHDEARQRYTRQARTLTLAAINSSTDWLDAPDLHCRTFNSTVVRANRKVAVDQVLDVVVLARSPSTRALEIHAIEILDSTKSSPKQMRSTFLQKSSLCHFFWFASIDKIDHTADGVPTGAGLLLCNAQTHLVSVSSKAIATDASRIKDTALVLLDESYRR